MGTDIVKRPSYPPVPQEQRRPESEALIPRAFRGARRNRHLSVPLAVPPSAWLVGEILHAAHALPETAIAGGVGIAAVWYFAPHKWTGDAGNPRPAEVWYARLSVVALAAWESLAAWLGADSGVTGTILGAILLALSAAWGVPWWRHKRPRGRRRRERMISRWDAWWQGHSHKWNLGGSRIIDAHETRVTVRIRVQLMPGSQSVQDVKEQVRKIESALEGMVEIGRIRVEACRNPSQADLFLKRDNPLREAIQWDPALAPRSVTEHAVIGLTETGNWFRVPQMVNSFVIGTTRSGKSNDLLVQAAQLAGCADARVILIDLKGGRSARPMLKAGVAEYVITGIDEARMYRAMIAAEVEARAKNAYAGEEQLEPSQDIPALFTFSDEVNPQTSVAAGDADCARLMGIAASQGSGLAIYERVYTQYGSLEESVRTEQTRSNLALRECYRVEEARHGQFVIPEYNKLDASKLEEQGTCYVKLGKDMHPEQVRAPKMSHALFEEIAAAAAERLAGRAPLRLYCGSQQSPAGVTWQEWWDRRWLRLDPAFRKISPQYAAAVAEYGQERETAQDGVPPRSPQDAEASPAVIIGNDARTVAARIAAETGGPDWAPDRRTASRLGTVIRQQKEAFADALQSATGTSPASPSQLAEESGMSSSWIHQTLARLAERGAAVKVGRGLYAAVPGCDIAAAVAAIEAGTDQLLKDARKVNRELAGQR